MSDVSARQEATESGHELVSERVPGPLEWVLYRGNRWYVAMGFLLGLLLALGGLLRMDLIAVENSDSITRLLAALVGGNLTLITVVISINQLILSREFSSPGDLHDQMRSVMDYRQEAAGKIDTAASPATPSDFLDFLVTILHEEAVALRDEAADHDDRVRVDLEEFTHALIARADGLSRTLESPERDPSGRLLTVLDAGFTADLYEARRIQTLHEDELSSTARTHLSDVVETLEHVGVARQYLKTLYFQRELADVSRKILYLGVPAFSLLLMTVMVYGEAAGPTIRGPTLEVLVVLTSVLGFGPLAVFFAYVLRIATITRRTASRIPFTIPDQSLV